MTRAGTRYVDVKELLEDERVKAIIRKAAAIEVESPHRNAPVVCRIQDRRDR